MKEILIYFWELVKRSPASKPFVAILRHIRRWFEYVITRHPSLLIASIFVICLVMVYSFANELTPKHECKVLEVNNEEMYGPAGDDISFGRARDCAKENKIVAIEFFNISDAVVPPLKKRIPSLVSGGLLVSEPARGRGSDDQHDPKWHEYMLFQRSNNFTWTAEPSKQYAFLADTCKEASGDNTAPEDITIRSGLLLKGEQLRPADYPDPKSVAACKGASQNNNFRKNDGCVLWNLEIFVPSLEPKELCSKRTRIDDWINPGTKKISLMATKELNILRQEAKARWDVKTAKSISIAKWNSQIINTPKLCIRWVDASYNPIDDQKSSWDEFGNIAQIWCDY